MAVKKRILALLPALALLLSGCASLLERSYTVVEPYTDRYWDTAAEDTLRAASYQDLVTSLLMLVEQRSEEGVIRYYGSSGIEPYMLALSARREVLEETVLGSYLLQDVTLSFSGEEDYSTLAFSFAYREGTESPENLMILSDTQSLMDLLRMAVREGHPMLTARFFEKIPRADVTDAVERLWQEMQADTPADTAQPPQDAAAESVTAPDAPTEEIPAAPTDPPAPPEGEGTAPAAGDGLTETPPPAAAPVPPCPWTIRFYPDRDAAEIVEILLTEN